jgi:hypothetical protein
MVESIPPTLICSLICSCTQFWFVSAISKYLNFATFSKDLLGGLCCDCVLHCADETLTYTNFFGIYFLINLLTTH